MSTIATHNGSQVSQDHNRRKDKVVSKEPHINPSGIHEIWHDEDIRSVYHKLFDGALNLYNARQTREERKIKDYYRKVAQSDIQHPVYEMIVGVYPGKGEHIDAVTQKSILKAYADDWSRRNPNLYMCGAYYHADEQGEPHIHIDYIPVAHGYKRGMDTQNGLVKALGEQGFTKDGRTTAQIKWERSENAYLEHLCNERGITVEHPQADKGVKHAEKELYIANKQLDAAQKEVATLTRRLDNARNTLEQANTLTDIAKAELKATEDAVTDAEDKKELAQRLALDKAREYKELTGELDKASQELDKLTQFVELTKDTLFNLQNEIHATDTDKLNTLKDIFGENEIENIIELAHQEQGQNLADIINIQRDIISNGYDKDKMDRYYDLVDTAYNEDALWDWIDYSVFDYNDYAAHIEERNRGDDIER